MESSKLLQRLSSIKKVLCGTCVLYTFFITALYILGYYIDKSYVPTLRMAMSLLLFSAVLSALNSFLFSDRLVFALRLLIHYVSTTIVFYIVFILWGGFQKSGGSVLTALLLYTFVYAICALIILMFRYLTAESRNSSKKYENKFDGRKSKADQNEYRNQFGGQDK